MAAVRLAFCGASGTGKTTLAKWAEQELKLPFNPVGSRSVAKAMGYDNPYDVDLPTEDHPDGRRAEFQRRLVIEKRKWEDAHESFVSDRTTLDNLVYTMFHDVYAIDNELLEAIIEGLKRYTHIAFFPVNIFCKVAGDPSRVGGGKYDADMSYHQLYDTTIKALIDKYRVRSTKMTSLYTADLEGRQAWIRRLVNGTETMLED